MWRRIYRGLIGLYPTRFQEEFGDEMLWIFDQEAAQGSPYWLIWDALLSLAARDFGYGATTKPVLALAGVPELASLEDTNLLPSYFRKGSLGAILAVGVIFPVIIANGAVSGQLRVPTVYTHTKQPPPNNDIDRWRLQALDLDSDGWISAEERAHEDALRWEPLFLEVERDGKVALADVIARIE